MSSSSGMKMRTKHGLDRKYKPWRKGKSTKHKLIPDSGERITKGSSSRSSNNGSLKNQLRSQRRFLTKITKQLEAGGSNNNNNNNNDDDSSKKEELQKMKEQIETKIQGLQNALSASQQTEREKKLSSKYHTIKFFERQKLTRMDKLSKKKLEEAKLATDFESISQVTKELEEIGWNMLYVAYYPNHLKYRALFPKQQQQQHTNNNEESMKKQRKRVLDQISDGIEKGEIIVDTSNEKSWVTTEFLPDKVKKWIKKGIKKRKRSMKDEFNKDKDDSMDVSKEEKEEVNMDDDDVKAEEDLKKLSVANSSMVTDNNENKQGTDDFVKRRKISPNNDGESSSSSNSSVSDNDDSSDSDSKKEKGKAKSIEKKCVKTSTNNENTVAETKTVPKKVDLVKKKEINDEASSDDSSSSSSSSSSDSDSDSSSDSSDDDSSSSDDEENNENDENNVTKQTNNTEESESSDDDFLVDDDNDEYDATNKKAFASAQSALTEYDHRSKGDKSRGWETQKQRPGQWKKKRERR